MNHLNMALKSRAQISTHSTGGGHVHRPRRRRRQQARDGRQICEGRRQGHEGVPSPATRGSIIPAAADGHVT